MMSRQRSLVTPREHGAWGILLVPLFTGACVGLATGGDGWDLAPLIIATLAAFWLRTPMESWMGTSPIRARGADEIRLVRNATIVLAAVSVAALAWLFRGGRNLGLIYLGGVGCAAFGLQAVVKRISRATRTASQMIAAVALTATAPAAYYVVTGRFGAVAWTLWAANLAFAMNQIQFVQMRIHAAKIATRHDKLFFGRAFLAAQVVLAAALAAACALDALRWVAALAFAPALVRGFLWFASEPAPLAPSRLGKSELAYACAFGIVLAAAMAM